MTFAKNISGLSVACTVEKFGTFRKRAGWLLFTALLWAACQKAELPPPSFDDPVFSIEFSAAPLPSQSVVAGENEVYLFTRHITDGQETVSTGAFSQSDCPDADCPGSLTFEFRSELSGVFDADAVFHLGNFTFVSSDTSGGTTLYRTNFFADSTVGYDSFSWKINDQSVGAGTSIAINFSDNTPRLVELEAQKTSGLKSTVRRIASLTNPGGSTFPVVGIAIEQDSSFGYQLIAETSGAPYDFLFWNTGDTTDFLYTDVLDTLYSVTIFADSIESSAVFIGLSAADVPLRSADFSYTVEPIFIPAPVGEVSIQWVDDAGTVWRSDRGPQSANVRFTVSQSEAYRENENGQKTRKMQVAFECLLFDDAGQGRPFTGTGTIAVAHP